MTDRSIAKIGLKKGKPTIKGQDSNLGAAKDFVIEGPDVAIALVATMAALLETLCVVCRLGEQWVEGEVTGLSLKSVGEGYGIVISGQLRVREANSPYVVSVNHPHLNEVGAWGDYP
jgi:hypothetical protein